MPIIFAQAIMLVPITIVGFSHSESLRGFAAAFSDFNGFWYNFTFALLIVAFTYFYTAITINPNQMAEDMKKNGGFISGATNSSYSIASVAAGNAGAECPSAMCHERELSSFR